MASIINFFTHFLDNLKNALKNLFIDLFVPSEERLTAIVNTVRSKFGFVDTINTAINSLQNILTNLGNSPKLTYNINSKYFNGQIDMIDMSWYAPFKPYGDIVITGFAYLLLLWRLFVHLPNIISGTGGDIAVSTNEYYRQIKGGYKK